MKLFIQRIRSMKSSMEVKLHIPFSTMTNNEDIQRLPFGKLQIKHLNHNTTGHYSCVRSSPTSNSLKQYSVMQYSNLAREQILQIERKFVFNLDILEAVLRKISYQETTVFPVQLGQKFFMDCGIYRKFENLWFFGGKLIMNNTTLLREDDHYKLKITNITQEHLGLYICINLDRTNGYLENYVSFKLLLKRHNNKLETRLDIYDYSKIASQKFIEDT